MDHESCGYVCVKRHEQCVSISCLHKFFLHIPPTRTFPLYLSVVCRTRSRYENCAKVYTSTSVLVPLVRTNLRTYVMDDVQCTSILVSSSRIFLL